MLTESEIENNGSHNFSKMPLWAISDFVGGSPLMKEAQEKHLQLRLDNIPPDDPRWVLEVSPDIFESAQLHGFDKLAGLRLVPRVTE